MTRVQDADGMPELADLGHVSATILSSSSGTLLIVRQLCSDTRFYVAVKSRPVRDSLIRRITSLMI